MARLWDSAFARWTHTPWQTLVDRNSIGLLVGRKFLDRITTLRSITSIGAWLTRTFSIGHHISRLDHTPISVMANSRWPERELSFLFCTPWSLKFLFLPSSFLFIFYIYILPSDFWNLIASSRAFETPHNALELFSLHTPLLFVPFLLSMFSSLFLLPFGLQF